MPIKLKTVHKRLLTIFILAVVLFLLGIFQEHPNAIEKYYSQGFYVWVCKLWHPVLNLVPFSVGDVIYIAVVISLIYIFCRVVYLLFKKRFSLSLNLLLGTVAGVQAGMVVFYVFWGLNYFRPSAAQRLNLRDTTFTVADMKTVTCIIIDSANATRARITHADTIQDNAAIYNTAVSAIKKISADSVNFRTYHPHIKSSLLSPLMNYLGTSGYYNPFTTEAQMNYQMPVFERPFIACHEMSHQMGYGPEDEANFAGFLAGIGSNDRLLRYSVYQAALDECMYALRRRDSTASNEMKPYISKQVRADLRAQRAYWMKFRGNLGMVSSIFYDDYLKANNQPQGMRTYNQMVLLLMAWYTK